MLRELLFLTKSTSLRRNFTSISTRNSYATLRKSAIRLGMTWLKPPGTRCSRSTSSNQKATRKFVFFDELVCEKNQNEIINYIINGRHRKCGVIYLSPSYNKVSKNIRDNFNHFCILKFLPQDNRRIPDELGVDPALLGKACDKQYSFFYYDNPQ